MCTRPNYMVWNGERDFEGKEKYSFQPHCNYDKILRSGSFFIQVPCGKCLECRQQHVSEWADRCVFHAKQYEHNLFITLTYDDDHLPADQSLVKDAISSFIHSLRDFMRYHYQEKDISYFGAAEYGSEGFRPHYHILVFNCNIRDLSEVFLREENGRLIKSVKPSKSNGLKFSKTIYDLWDRKGLISVGEVNYQTCAYVAGYCEKKTDLRREKLIKKLGLTPEYVRMSKGLGKVLYDPDMFELPLIVPKSGKAKISVVPRYYEKLLKKNDELQFAILKHKQANKRRVACESYLHSNRLKDVDNYAREAANTTKYNRHI